MSIMQQRFLYIKTHKHIPEVGKPASYVQRIVPMRNVQWVEYDADRNEVRVKTVGSGDGAAEVYGPEGKTAIDREVVKRLFYDILKDARAEGKVIEGW